MQAAIAMASPPEVQIQTKRIPDVLTSCSSSHILCWVDISISFKVLSGNLQDLVFYFKYPNVLSSHLTCLCPYSWWLQPPLVDPAPLLSSLLYQTVGSVNIFRRRTSVVPTSSSQRSKFSKKQLCSLSCEGVCKRNKGTAPSETDSA